jgi:hypothetical protein
MVRVLSEYPVVGAINTDLSEVNYLTTELSLTPIPDSFRRLSISSQQSPEPTVKNT